MDRLDAAAIALPGVVVRVVERCTSTNDLLLKKIEEKTVLIAAEEQTAGRGRRGRRWHSAPGAGVTFSLGRRVRRPVRELPALSLVAGVAAARVLRSLGVRDAALKWPNDLVVAGAKLGGILVESRDRDYVVVGIGINCRRVPGLAKKLRRRICCLEEFVSVPRNEVIQGTAKALLEALDAFEARGLEALRAEWESMDAHAGQRVRVRLADGRTVSGVARGLCEDGSLKLQTRNGVRAVHSGRLA